MSSAAAASTPGASSTCVSADEAVRLVREHGPGIVIDVRTPVELRESRIEGACHVPLDELPARAAELARAGERARLILCRSGRRAETACELLARAGARDVAVVEGGILAYAEAGGETVGDRSVISLERQVRIAAGSLVLLGVTLGFAAHPAFFGLSAFVGAGLVFAGVTDTCGMGMLLARMPWNR